MQMLVHVTGMTIDVPDAETARLYESRGFASPVVPEGEPKTQRKRAPRKTKTDK